MTMYYDLRGGVFNGAFDLRTLRPLKGYYPLYWYGMFYDMEKFVPCTTAESDIYTLAGIDGHGKVLAVVTYYTDNDTCTDEKSITLNFGREGKYELYLLDANHDAELFDTVTEPNFTLKPNSCMLVKEIN